jgi:DNA-directed RNA polymerase subunit RPC12/RpoP
MTRAGQAPAPAPQAVGDALAAERWLDEGGSFSRPIGQPIASGTMPSGTLIALPKRLAPAASPASRPAYACPECGHLLRVSGLGRHRVYFELGDERSEDPVMNRVCPACGHRLPGKNPR